MAENKIIPIRPRAALITNHGYAGVDIPVGGAPDTGGQNFYVNSLARALEENGYDVTIFTRGGFPFFGSERQRIGFEKLSANVQYIYVPGGPAEFIPKEEIAIALDEEAIWIYRHIQERAEEVGCAPWQYYDFVNTHYWDAAMIAVKLVERWTNDAALAYLTKANDGVFSAALEPYRAEAAHRNALARELDYHLGQIAEVAAGGGKVKEILRKLLGPDVAVEPKIECGPGEQEVARSIRLGRAIRRTLKVDGESLDTALKRPNTHVWTAHSFAVIKERNYWDKPPEAVRPLKFRERDSHEQVICRRTRLFSSSSPELWRSLVSYHHIPPRHVFEFPPCIDRKLFHPRTKDELAEQYDYLTQLSGISRQELMGAKIVFETSRMDQTKRKDILLRAFARVATKREDAYLFIGGGPSDCPLFAKLTALIDSMEVLRGRAFLLGFIPEQILPPLFSLADLFVSASEMEGFGMSVSEAAGSGVALVSSDLIPFATQYAKESAVIVKAGDVDGFATAIDRLLSDDEDRERRASELLEIAQRLNWLQTTKRFINWVAERQAELNS